MPSATKWILAAAVATVVGGWAAPGWAQYRVETGNARDANNRLGSGGSNDGASRAPGSPYGIRSPYASSNTYQLNNNIVTGNITGGRQFRGVTGSVDPFAFRGNAAGSNIDRFVRGSSGVTTGGTPSFNAQNELPFYGISRGVAPPPGFGEVGATGGFVPQAQPINRQPGDMRLGSPLGAPPTVQPRPGQLLLPGPVDPNSQTSDAPAFISASPLMGIRQVSVGMATTPYGASFGDPSAVDPSLLRQSFQSGRPIDSAEIQRMRNEVMLGSEPMDSSDPSAPRDRQRLSDTPNLGQPLPAPFESPNADPMRDRPLDGVRRGNEPLTSNVRTDQSTRQRLLTAQPERLSPQYAELQRRLERYQTEGQRQASADPDASRKFAEQVRRQQQAEAAGQQPGMPGQPAQAGQQPQAGLPGQPGMQPGQQGIQPGQQGVQPGTPQAGVPNAPGRDQTPLERAGQPDYTRQAEQVRRPDAAQPAQPAQPGQPGVAPGAPRERPLQIDSLARDVQAKGLKEVMTEAEELMKQQKFASALERYDTAELVAPNNPLVALGRAHAELGASYYSRAETHLREAFRGNPALLMGQYDLRSFLGDDRLQFLVKDLKEIANKEERSPRPAFLLAYIAYNTGNESMAASYLDLAEKRAGGQDPVFQLLRKHWVLPEPAPAGTGSEPNK